MYISCISQHDNNIIHRDLKAENILFTSSSSVKVADFGFSTKISNRSQMLDTFCGCPPYAAPELFKHVAYMGPPVDVWAMGVLLFFMVTGTMPFHADTIPNLCRCVLQGVYVLPPWVSAPCQRLIWGILKPEPTECCALDQILGCEWMLPVEILRPVPHLYQLNSVHLLKVQPGWAEQEEVHAALQELGVTEEHILNNQGKNSRSPVTGIYHIVLHQIQRNRGTECLPLITGVVKDPKWDILCAYRNLRHTSKLCALS